MRLRRLSILALPFLTACPGSKPPPSQPPAASSAGPGDDEPVVVRQSKSGLGFRLTELDPSNGPKNKLARTTNLPEADTKQLLDRLPAFSGKDGDEKDFALRDKSQPPPRTSKPVAEPFPPPKPPDARPPSVAAGALKVLRHLPEGEVSLAPHLSITFSQPMVPVTSHGDLEGKPRPVKISPEPKGKWRWIGTQTLLFEPDPRFPMATRYEVEVPAGVKSESGAELAAAERWSFATPPPQLRAMSPQHHSVKLDALMHLGFDQAVDPEAILKSALVRADGGGGALAGVLGGDKIAVRLATDDEMEADPEARAARSKAEEKKRHVFLKSVEKLPRDAGIRVSLPAGTPSAEGPRTTEKEQGFSFRTFGALRAHGADCGWREALCAPLGAIFVHFSNPLEASKFEKSMVKIDPPIDGFKASVSYSTLVLSGRTRGRTKYKISLSNSISDVHGQNLDGNGTFEVQVGSAEPVLFPEERAMAVLDPEGTPTMPLYTINRTSLRARLYAVGPEEWEAYNKFRNDWDWEGKRHDPPGKLVATKILPIKEQPDELVETPLDLTPALRDGVGQVIVVVEPTTPPPKDRPRESVRAWLQVTKMGIDALSDSEQSVGWITALSSGAPVPGAEVSLLRGPGASSGPDGLARIDHKGIDGTMLVARKGSDLAMLPGHSGTFHAYREADHVRWLVFDDRKTYKPGEDAKIKGFLRLQKSGKGEELAALPSGLTLHWVAKDSRGVEIGKGEGVPVSAQGGFDFALKLPKTPNLGSASVHLDLDKPPANGGSHVHSLQVEEFRRPEFEVTTSAGPGPYKVGQSTTLTVAAKYYAGGGLADAPVQWSVRSSDASFRPPNRTDYHFGPEPWGWWRWRESSKPDKDRTERIESTTTGQGDHRLRADFDALDPPYPMTLDVEATVTDVNRQAWTSRTSLLVHPGDLYVGLRLDRGFVRAGEGIRVDALVTDLEGRAAPGTSFTVRSARIESEQIAGEWKELEKDPESCDLTSGPSEPAPCKLTPKQGGRYRLTAVVADRHGRKSQTQQTFWVYGEGMTPDHGLAQDRAQIVVDKNEFSPGDQAEMLVFAPFAPAEGVVAVRRQGLVHLERFTMKSRVQAIKVPIGEGSFPSVEASVHLVGTVPRKNLAGDPDPKLPPQPAFASGTTRLSVPPRSRKIAVKARARDEALEPGGNTTVEVDLTDAQGAPVAGAEVAIAVVDEAILALGAYSLPDPLALFYAPRPGGVVEIESRQHVLLGRIDERSMKVQAKQEPKKPDGNLPRKAPKTEGGRASGGLGLRGAGPGGGGLADGVAFAARPTTATAAPAPMASAAAVPMDAAPAAEAPAKPAEKEANKKAEDRRERDKDDVSSSDKSGSKEKTPIAQRSNFDALAAFVPAAISDGSGKVTVPVKLPDSLTRYRIMAVAARDQSFGHGEGTLTARLPLMVRPSAPRFLNYGDRFDFPIVVQNQTNAAMEVDLVARAANAALPEGQGRHFTVPANDRVEVRLPASALRPGTARFQIGIASGRFADASTVEMPVWTPATTEAFATYGQIDEGAVAQTVKMPSGVVKEFGGLEITTSSTAVSALTDAVLYLTKYPYDCNEQISSRILAIASLRDVLTAFKSKDLPPPEVLKASVASDLTRLAGRQHWNGGFSFWGRDHEPWPYLTVHVVHALSRAKDKGYDVPANMLQSGQQYLRVIESHYPWYYSPETRRAITSYALFVRKRLGDADPARAHKLIEEAGGADKTPLESLGWLLPVLSGESKYSADVEAIRKHLANRVSETAGAAHFATSYGDGAYVLLHSDRRADGVILDALIGDQPKSDLIPKLVAGLLNHRKAGRWGNTQENAFVLLALDRYFNTYESATPDFVARAWLGDRFAGQQTFKGRSTDSHELKIPMKTLAEVGEAPLTLLKEGPGRLYYRVGMQYAPEDLRPPPADHGFTVRRAYEGVDSPDDVQLQPSGAWLIKAGAKVRVRLSMIAQGRRYHVALVDPIPAGLEAMNPSLAVTGTIPQDPKQDVSPTWWWSRAWYEHQNMRDERVEAFASLLYDGIYDYSYVARATTPGTFVVPPAKAEEMYAPETFGRSAGDTVIVQLEGRLQKPLTRPQPEGRGQPSAQPPDGG